MNYRLDDILVFVSTILRHDGANGSVFCTKTIIKEFGFMFEFQRTLLRGSSGKNYEFLIARKII